MHQGVGGVGVSEPAAECMHALGKAWHAGNLIGEADLGKVLDLAISWKALRWPWRILRSCTEAR